MKLKEFRKQYPDANQIVMYMTSETMLNHNLYNTNELREYLQSIYPGSSVLDCNCSGRKVTAIISEEAYKEEKRQLAMLPGVTVTMTGAEGNFPEYKDKKWKVYAGPQWMCGSLVVWLEGYSGAYSCQHLEIVNN